MEKSLIPTKISILEYKNSNNGWTQIQYLPGSTTGGSVTNVNYNLPANAYHSSFQIRARQNAGSGTCCDYWFFDDVILPGTSGANLPLHHLAGVQMPMSKSMKVDIHQYILTLQFLTVLISIGRYSMRITTIQFLA